MPRYSVETQLGPEQVLEKARARFQRGLGLEVVRQEDPCLIRFEGGGGHVLIVVDSGEDKNSVDLETREWDFHVREFMREISKEGR